MKTVHFTKSIYIESLGRTFKKGESAELPDQIADRHLESGFAKIQKSMDVTKERRLRTKSK